jgi:hypothetical protein
MRTAYKVLVGNHFAELGVDGRLVLDYMLVKWSAVRGVMWIELAKGRLQCNIL